MSNVSRREFRKPTVPVRTSVLLGLSLSLITAICLFASPLPAQEHKTSLPEFNLTLGGDAIIVTSAPARQNDPRFMGVVTALHKGDAAVLNIEGTFAGREAYPVYDSGGTWVASDPERLKDLQWMGFNLFSMANNHVLDYSGPGLLDTIHVFQQDHAVYAGIGETLGEARAPGYLTTPHGRIALISCASTFSAEAPAGDARPDIRGRPGVSALRHLTRYRVDAPTYDALSKMKQYLQLDNTTVRPPTQADAPNLAAPNAGSQGQTNSAKFQKLTFDGTGLTFELSDNVGTTTSPDPRDLAQITHSIRDAREMADYVVTYIHAHEQTPGSDEIPAQFVVQFAHDAVDAGTDVFAASGPHVLRGIEIYKGKVIFYNLGNFIFENDLVVPQPTDLYETFGLDVNALPSELFDARTDHDRRNWPSEPRDWESVIPDVVFREGRPAAVTLTPITLGYGEMRPERGYPRLADAAKGIQILERLQRLSQPYGTNIVIKDGIGTITIPSVRP
jgi:poly-gamma-glutamate capsule biosynthesis protein CapA/YwtB (metallophosphatase superfamily)